MALTITEIGINRLKKWNARPKRSHINENAVMESIKVFGFLVPILCDSRFRVIAGHTRLQAARRLGLKTVPVIVLPVKGWRRNAFAIVENELSRKCIWKQSELVTHLNRLAKNGLDVSALGFDSSMLKALVEEKKSVNWKNIDHHLKKSGRPQTSAMIVKVPSSLKETLKNRATKYGIKLGLRTASMPSLVGAVLMSLLGVKP